MIIAVEGCAHGELEDIYDTISCLEEKEGVQVDLLICCGDFQASRNHDDLLCMAIPAKYHKLCTFYKYYSGEKEAPVLTIFIGGNHEASNYLQELPYGGWVAPKIYYLGYAAVINIAGLRIGGISGIHKGHDYLKGHFEKAPYSEDTKRSVYHVRNLEVFRLKQISRPVDIFLSHDWPSGVWQHGDEKQLIRNKPFFKPDIESGKLGSKPCEELLNHLRPKYWFAAHLHCKFAALIKHNEEESTKFLALDKCLPKRKFLQILDVPHDPNMKTEICYDLEWLAVLYLTNHLLNIKNTMTYMPGPGDTERWLFTPTDEEKELISSKFEGNLLVPQNFVRTVNTSLTPKKSKQQPRAQLNPQTKNFCAKLSIDDPLELVLKINGENEENQCLPESSFENLSQTFIEDTDVSDTSFGFVSPFKKMSLPEPKQESYGALDPTEVRATDEKDSSELKSVTEPAEDVKESVQTENDFSKPKKFVRRNIDIYKNEDNY